ncbi:unnamed protein product, partial [Pylaiella littoralis]
GNGTRAARIEGRRPSFLCGTNWTTFPSDLSADNPMASVCAKELIRIRRTAGWRNQAPGFSEYFRKVVGESEGITGSCGYSLACFRHGFRRMRGEVHFRIVPYVALSSQANKQRLLYLLKTWKPVKRR